MLNANVAFLGNPIVAPSLNTTTRSPAQIAIYFSIVASFGTEVFGLLLARRHRADTSVLQGVSFYPYVIFSRNPKLTARVFNAKIV